MEDFFKCLFPVLILIIHYTHIDLKLQLNNLGHTHLKKIFLTIFINTTTIFYLHGCVNILFNIFSGIILKSFSLVQLG